MSSHREQEEAPKAGSFEEMSADELETVAGGAVMPGSLGGVVPTNSTVPVGAVVTPYPSGWVPSPDQGLANSPTGLPPMVPEGGAPLGY